MLLSRNFVFFINKLKTLNIRDNILSLCIYLVNIYIYIYSVYLVWYWIKDKGLQLLHSSI